MDERQKKILDLLPLTPDEKFDAWARRQPAMQKNVIVFKIERVPGIPGGKTEKMARCCCSACEAVFYQPVSHDPILSVNHVKQVGFGWVDEYNQPIGNEDACTCPCCGAEALSLHSSKIPKDGRTVGVVFTLQVMKLGGVPVLICWRYRKVVEKTGGAWIEVDRYEAYSFHGKKSFRYSGFVPGYLGSALPVDDWEARGKCYDGIKEHKISDVYPFRRDVFRGTELENAKFKEYMESSRGSFYPVTYLRTFQMHRQVENLIVQGAAELFNQIVYANITYYGYGYYIGDCVRIPDHGINWKSKRPAEMMGLNREEWRYFSSQPWNLDVLEAYKKIRAAGYRINIFPYAVHEKPVSMTEAVDFAEEGYDPDRVCRYLDKQNKKHNPPEECDGTMLWDYWRMAVREGLRLESDSDMFPPDLYGSHNQVMELQNRRLERERREFEIRQAKKQKKEATQYADDFRELAERWAPLEYHADGLMIRIAAEARELIEEGLQLHHCVGGYIRSHAAGKRCIFFVRQEDDPTKPFYTLELNMETLGTIQNRGNRNCKRTPEVEAFEKKWLEHIRQFEGLNQREKVRISA